MIHSQEIEPIETVAFARGFVLAGAPRLLLNVQRVFQSLLVLIVFHLQLRPCPFEDLDVRAFFIQSCLPRSRLEKLAKFPRICRQFECQMPISALWNLKIRDAFLVRGRVAKRSSVDTGTWRQTKNTWSHQRNTHWNVLFRGKSPFPTLFAWLIQCLWCHFILVESIFPNDFSFHPVLST